MVYCRTVVRWLNRKEVGPSLISGPNSKARATHHSGRQAHHRTPRRSPNRLSNAFVGISGRSYRPQSPPTASLPCGRVQTRVRIPPKAPNTQPKRRAMSARRNRRVSNGHRRRQIRARILAAYDTCAICGKPVDKTLKTPHPMSAEVDELIPISRGGDPYSFTNCRLTHRRCNRLKSDKTDEHARTLLAGRTTPRTSTLPYRTFGL